LEITGGSLPLPHRDVQRECASEQRVKRFASARSSAGLTGREAIRMMKFAFLQAA